MPDGYLTRRQLVAGGGAIWAGLSAAPAAFAPPALSAALPAAGPGDRKVLERALEIERLLVWTYQHVLAVGTLAAAGRAVVTQQLQHERDHVMALAPVVGAGPDGGLGTAAALAELARHHVGSDPRRLGTQRDSVRLLVDLESVAEGVWFRAVGRLEDPLLAQLGAQIMACEAQHWTVLSELSHPGEPVITVPNAFVRGT